MGWCKERTAQKTREISSDMKRCENYDHEGVDVVVGGEVEEEDFRERDWIERATRFWATMIERYLIGTSQTSEIRSEETSKHGETKHRHLRGHLSIIRFLAYPFILEIKIILYRIAGG